MGTTAEKLNYLQATKVAIKEALVAKGVDVGGSDTFRSYAEKIKKITTSVDVNKPIKFYDYDGTLLYSYSVEEYYNLTEEPQLPTHNGLIAQKWNFSRDDVEYFIQNFQHCSTGALYKTTDGKTRLYIELHDDLSISLCLGYSGGVTVDWGDGSDSVSESAVIEHIYNAPGNYTISIDAQSYRLGTTSNPLIKNKECYDKKLVAIEIGDNCFGIVVARHSCLKSIVFHEADGTAFCYIHNCPQLECVINSKYTKAEIFNCPRLRVFSSAREGVSLKNIGSLKEISCYGSAYTRVVNCPSVTRLGGRVSFTLSNYYPEDETTFEECSSLMTLKVADMKTLPKNCFAGCECLETIEVRNDGIIDYIGERAFYNCISLKGDITISSNVTKILKETFYSCQSLQSVTFQGAINEIASYAFFRNYNMKYIDLSHCEKVPDIGSDSVMIGSLPTKIIVPDSLYEEWVSAAKWSTYASQIVKASEYNG